MTVYQKLIKVQVELKAPKNQYNSFGKYKYRNAEDIMEALKPILAKHNATVFINDEIVFVEGRHYVKTTATFVDIETGETIQTTALAREEETKKGMDGSQITGASSSYSKKYCLSNLLLIDDTRDSDATNTHGKDNNTNTNTNSFTNNNEITYGDTFKKITLSDKQLNWLKSLSAKKGKTVEQIIQAYNTKFSKNISLDNITREDFDKLIELLQGK